MNKKTLCIVGSIVGTLSIIGVVAAILINRKIISDLEEYLSEEDEFEEDEFEEVTPIDSKKFWSKVKTENAEDLMNSIETTIE